MFAHDPRFTRSFCFGLSFVLLALSAWFGAAVLSRQRDPTEDIQDEYSTILAATLTLLGLIIGFTFSMAITRYDQRKNLEEEEANAIGTAYVRADLLPSADAARVRTLLKEYLDLRIEFYETREPQRLPDIAARRAKLQADLWTTVQRAATAQPTPVIALAGQRNERRAERAGLYAGGVVESNPASGVAADDHHRGMQQCPDRIRCTPDQSRWRSFSCRPWWSPFRSSSSPTSTARGVA